ncbi:hypothetical protein CRG98_014376, partial [Punica granatum]
WSAIAAKLPGRTDNEIKNVWHTHLKKRLKHSGASPKHESDTGRKSQPSSSTSTLQESQTPASRPMSPQPSSSEISSVTETSTVARENNNNLEVKSEQADFSMESLPMIDDSFWTDPMSNSPSGESSDFSTLTNSTVHIQFPFIESADMSNGELLWNDNHVLNMDDGMEFWYDLFIGAGGVQELPDF